MESQSLYSFDTNPTALGTKKKIVEVNRIFKDLVPRLCKPSTILEIGPGRGEFAEIVRDNGFEYIGIEPSKSLGSNLISRGFKVLANPLPKIKLDNNSIDVVYSYDVLEHMGNYSNVLEFFRESYRILKPGGYITTIAPNAETLGILFYTYEYQHNFFTSIPRIKTLLKDSGFDPVSSRTFLTLLGLSNHRMSNCLDRLLAHTSLLFGRNIIITAILRATFGEKLVFKLHKNLYDHIAVVARKPYQSGITY